VQEQAGGELMAAFYGVPSGAADDALRVLAVVFSRDGGATWGEHAIVHEDRRGDICSSEAYLLPLSEGCYLAMIRGNAQKLLYRAFSWDSGRTWTPLEVTELPGQCPSLIRLASGEMLCAYRDTRPASPGVSCAISRDQGKTWRVVGQLHRGSNRDCGYPFMVSMDGGLIYAVFYTAAVPAPMTGTTEIHGVILRYKTMPFARKGGTEQELLGASARLCSRDFTEE
jgi:hypothetical protein